MTSLGGFLQVVVETIRDVLPIALLVLIVYIILVTTPVWLAWMEDDVHEVLERTRKT